MKPIKPPKERRQFKMTNRGNFVTREMGAEIALASGQIRELKFNQQELFSEDLY